MVQTIDPSSSSAQCRIAGDVASDHHVAEAGVFQPSSVEVRSFSPRCPTDVAPAAGYDNFSDEPFRVGHFVQSARLAMSLRNGKGFALLSGFSNDWITASLCRK